VGRHREPLSPELHEISELMRARAADGGGMITAAQCRPFGANPTVIRRLLRSGRWRRARRGVYHDVRFVACRLSERAATHHAWCAGLVAALGTGVAISHTSAARLLDLPLPPGTPDELVLTRRPPARTNRFGPRTRVHALGFTDAEVQDVRGVPVLGGARMVLDCCTVLDPPDALAIADAALHRNVVTPAGLGAELRRWPGRPGTRTAAVVLERADRRAENWLESISRWWLAEAGLPRPVLQQRFTDGFGAIRARVDFWFPRQRIVGEADGALTYTDPGAFHVEKRREDWLRDQHGVEVVRWVTAEMLTPNGRAGVIDRFRRAAARRR
jgi:hypothetical protein